MDDLKTIIEILLKTWVLMRVFVDIFALRKVHLSFLITMAVKIMSFSSMAVLLFLITVTTFIEVSQTQPNLLQNHNLVQANDEHVETYARNVKLIVGGMPADTRPLKYTTIVL